MSGFLRKNLSLKIFCVFLAIFLWVWVKYTQGPWSQTTSQITFYLPVRIENLAPGVKVVQRPERVAVQVKGPPEAIANLREQHFQAYVDLKQKGEGPYILPINVSMPPGITLVDKDPSQAFIRLDSVKKETFPIVLETTGQTASGFAHGKVRFDPPTVTVEGRKGSLNRISQVEARVDLSGANMNLIRMVQPIPVDKKGNPISGLRVSPKTVFVEVPVLASLPTRVLRISPDLVGNVAKGHRITSIRLEPSRTSVIVHQPEAMTAPLEICTRPINIQDLSESQEFQVALSPPPGTMLAGVKTAIVVVEVERASPESTR